MNFRWKSGSSKQSFTFLQDKRFYPQLHHPSEDEVAVKPSAIMRYENKTLKKRFPESYEKSFDSSNQKLSSLGTHQEEHVCLITVNKGLKIIKKKSVCMCSDSRG